MPTGHETVSSQMEPEHGCFSIRSSEVLGLRSTLTSCLGDNAPKGVIVGQGETCSPSPVTLHLPQNKRRSMQGMAENEKIDGRYYSGMVECSMVGLGRQIQFVKGLKVKTFQPFHFAQKYS